MIEATIMVILFIGMVGILIFSWVALGKIKLDPKAKEFAREEMTESEYRDWELARSSGLSIELARHWLNNQREHKEVRKALYAEMTTEEINAWHAQVMSGELKKKYDAHSNADLLIWLKGYRAQEKPDMEDL